MVRRRTGDVRGGASRVTPVTSESWSDGRDEAAVSPSWGVAGRAGGCPGAGDGGLIAPGFSVDGRDDVADAANGGGGGLGGVC